MSNTVWIVGYGSLMSQQSTFRTCPSAKNFGAAIVCGWTRVFNLVSLSNIKAKSANFSTNELAAVAVRRQSTAPAMICSVFSIPIEELSAYYEREARYQYAETTAYQLSDSSYKHVDFNSLDIQKLPKVQAVICYEFNDNCFRSQRFKSNAEYEKLVGQFYSGRFWRNDIFPVPEYLHLCLRAVFELAGMAGLQNFVDTSYLADGFTSIRDYWRIHKSIAPEMRSLLF